MTAPTPSPREPKQVVGVARHGKLRQTSPFATFGKVIASAIAVVLVATGGVAAYAVVNLTSKVTTIDIVNEAGEVEVIPDVNAIPGGFNLLLVGSDGRDDYSAATELDMLEAGSARNDVTMLLHVAEDHQSATLVSFTRDLLVSIPSCPDGQGGYYSAMSRQMLNESLGYGGLACSVLTVEGLTGLDIQYAAEIGFDGVIGMSNAVGGVEVCSVGPLVDEYVGLNLPDGTSTIEGEDALKFLRSRHGVGDGGDVSRISNQQVFLSSLLRTIKDSGTLTDVTKLYGLASAAISNMTLSSSLGSPETMVKIALALSDIPLSSMTLVAYPTTAAPEDENRAVALEPDAETLMQTIRDDQPVVLTDGQTGVGSVKVGEATEEPAASDTAEPTDDTTAEPSDEATSEPTDPEATEEPTDTTTAGSLQGQSVTDQTCSNPYYF